MSRATPGLTFIERILYGFLFSASIALALSASPLWDHLPDITVLLPTSYASTLDAIPGPPNTALAFVLTLIVATTMLFLLREPTAGLGLLAAIGLGAAAYPYGRVRWHRLFLDTPLDANTPGPVAWITALIPVLLLFVPPLVAHIRSMRDAYTAKGADRTEVDRLTRHLTKSGAILAGMSLGIAVALGLLITLGSLLLTSETRLLGRNSALVMLLVALLLVFALGIGTGLFQKPEPGITEAGEDEGTES